MNKLFRIVPEVFIAVIFVLTGFWIVGGLTILFGESFLGLDLISTIPYSSRVVMAFSPTLFLFSYFAESHIKDSKWRVLK